MANEHLIPHQPSAEEASRFEETLDEHGLFQGSYAVPPMKNTFDERYGQEGWFTRIRTARTMAECFIQHMDLQIHDVYVTPKGDEYAQRHAQDKSNG